MMMPGGEVEVVGVRKVELKEKEDLLPPIEQLKMTHSVEEAVDPFREENEEDLPNLDDMIQLSAEREEAVVVVPPPGVEERGRRRRDSSSSEGSSGVEEDLLL